MILPGDLFGSQHQNEDGLVLGILFLTLSCADIRFAESSSRRRTRLQTTKRVEFFSPNKLAVVTLVGYDEALWCMCHPSGARPRRPRMFILLAKQNCLALLEQTDLSRKFHEFLWVSMRFYATPFAGSRRFLLYNYTGLFVSCF